MGRKLHRQREQWATSLSLFKDTTQDLDSMILAQNEDCTGQAKSEQHGTNV